MYKATRRLVIAVLMTIVGTGSPILVAQDKQQSSSAAGSAVAGKTLWEFNTNG